MSANLCHDAVVRIRLAWSRDLPLARNWNEVILRDGESVTSLAAAIHATGGTIEAVEPVRRTRWQPKNTRRPKIGEILDR